MKPSSYPGASFTGPTVPTALPVQPQSTVIQTIPATVAVSVPITMTRFQTAIRTGTTVTLAPKAVPTPSGSYSGSSSHVPKGLISKF